MKHNVMKQTRVGTVLSARRRSCTQCGTTQVHTLVRAGVRRWLRWGPPAYMLEQYALCNTCCTRQPLDGWFDGPTEPVTIPRMIDLTEYERTGRTLLSA
jgi:hypothetical protein